MNNVNENQVPPTELDDPDVFNVAAYVTSDVEKVLFEFAMTTLKADFEAGHKFALMQAIDECASAGFPMPCWVADAYGKAFAEIHGAKTRSWDDVFGKPFEKGTQLPYIRKAQAISSSVREELEELKRNRVPLTSETYDALAKRYNTNRDTLKRILDLSEPGNTSRLF
jgi:hypothetical protein